MAGDEDRREVIIERENGGPGTGLIIGIILLVIVVLFLLFGGWRWIGNSGTNNTTNIQAPAGDTGTGTSSTK